jgi:hypothetical protein
MADKLTPKQIELLKDPRFIIALHAVKPLQHKRPMQNSKKKSTK